MKLISFDLRADMGFLKKPDINEKIYLTYNMLHKPALLGILGAIAGLKGYEKNGEFPEYYHKLKHLKIGIEPLDSDKGNYTKTTVTYNNSSGFCNIDKDDLPCNLVITEQILLKPAFRCYLLLDTTNEIENVLYKRIVNQEAEYLPYFGKNDFSAWWERNSVHEYVYSEKKSDSSFQIISIFHKDDTSIRQSKESLTEGFDLFSTETEKPLFFYFEKLPIGFNESLLQYEVADFAYTSAKLKKDTLLRDLYLLESENVYVQLF